MRASAPTIMIASEALRISDAKRASTRSTALRWRSLASSRRITLCRAMTSTASTKIATVMMVTVSFPSPPAKYTSTKKDRPSPA